MAAEALTIHLPPELYEHIRQRAEQTHISLEEAALDVLASGVAADEKISSDILEAVAGLSLLTDEQLWHAARSHLPAEMAEELADLNSKRQREGLTYSEEAASIHLLHHYDRYMLVRAEAAVLLMQRGHDISSLGPK